MNCGFHIIDLHIYSERKRTQRTQRSFSKNVKERKERKERNILLQMRERFVLFFNIYIYRYIYRHSWAQLTNNVASANR